MTEITEWRTSLGETETEYSEKKDEIEPMYEHDYEEAEQSRQLHNIIQELEGNIGFLLLSAASN